MEQQTIVIDATNAILGRLASYVAKQALLGKTIAVVNCEKALVSGSANTTFKAFQAKRGRVGSGFGGPKYHKSPEKIVKRTVRGMLAHRQGRGDAALKRVKCYNSMPQEFAEMKKIVAGKEKPNKTVTLQEVSKQL